MFCDRRSSIAGTPTDVTAIGSNYNSVLVSWTALLHPPAGYEVFYQMSARNHTRLSAVNTSDTELTVTGLTLGVTYHIFVVSYGAEEALASAPGGGADEGRREQGGSDKITCA